MQYRKLGRSDLTVSALSLGCWSMAGGGMWGEQDAEDSIATIRTAQELGINFFDTAEGYGNGYSEELLAQALGHRRQEVIIATKVSQKNLRAPDVVTACERSLKRLNTDYIDVYYIHWPSPEIPISETMEAFERLRTEGKIRVTACSNFASGDLEKLLRHGRAEANQLPYSLLWRAIEYHVTPYCQEQGVSVTCYSPLSQGLLTGRYHSADEVPPERARTRHFSSHRSFAEHGHPGVEELLFDTLDQMRKLCDQAQITMTQAALGWAMAQPGVGSVIAGARKPEQIRQSASACDIDFSRDFLNQLSELSQKLKEELGPSPDKWSVDSSRYDCMPDEDEAAPRRESTRV